MACSWSNGSIPNLGIEGMAANRLEQIFYYQVSKSKPKSNLKCGDKDFFN